MNPNITIESFIIFDSTLSKSENDEENKILYFYPKAFNIKNILKTIGLCEAMSNFAREFTDEPCQFIHTLKTRISLLNLENNIWLVLTVNVPKSSGKEDEYLEEEVQNPINASVLKHCQRNFCLFKGPPSLIIEESGIDGLREKLMTFFDRYICSGMLESYHLVDTLDGVSMLPIDKDTYFKVSTLINGLETSFKSIQAAQFLFSNSHIHGSVPQQDLGIIYRYLIITLFPKINSQDKGSASFNNKNMGKFVIKPEDNINLFLDVAAYLSGNIKSSPRHCQVLVYRALQSDIVLFFDKESQLTPEVLNSIHEFLGPRVTILSQDIAQKFGKTFSESPYKYLYWNPDSLSVKCSLFPTRSLKSDFPPLVPLDVMQLMTDIEAEVKWSDEYGMEKIREFGVKLSSDSWVVCLKKCNRRLLLAINKRNFSMVDVSKELKSACDRDFPNVFSGEDTNS